MKKIVHLSYLHEHTDSRIFNRHVKVIKNFTNYPVVFYSKNICSFSNKWLRLIEFFFKIIFRYNIFKDSKKNKTIYFLHDPLLLIFSPLLIMFGVVIFDAHEDLPLQIMHKIRNKRIAEFISLLSKLFLSFYCYFFVKRVIVVVDSMLQRWYHPRAILFPNFEVLTPFINNNSGKQSNKIFDFIYSGNISPERGADHLIEFIDIALSFNKKIAVMTFDSEYTRNLFAKYSHIENFAIIFSPGRQIIEYYYSISKMGLCFLHLTPAYYNSYPVKIIEYLFFGLPFISTNVFFAANIVSKYHCGIIVANDNTSYEFNSINNNFDLLYSELAFNLQNNSSEILSDVSFPTDLYVKFVYSI